MSERQSHEHYRHALDLLCAKLVEDEAAIGTDFPYITGPNGQWQLLSAAHSAGYKNDAWSHGNWFCGFWVGLLLAAHLHSGEQRFLDMARARMLLVAQRAEDPNTHDLGFIFLSSAMPLLRITGEDRYRQIGLSAADTLRRRLVATPKGAYLASWGPLSDERGRSSSAIDTMANLSLLYWAARESGDASYRLAGEAHARMTDINFTRPDQTLVHAVEYDAETGERRRGLTFQGYDAESSWSRGTAWAVYGFSTTAAATGQNLYLKRAETLAKKWLDQIGERIVPPWDFDDPAPNAPEDSSASAIMAAGLFDVASQQSNHADSARWEDIAHRLLSGLVTQYLAHEPEHRGLLKHGCYSKPHNIGTDAAVMFGDYFFVEALCRVLMPNRFIQRLEPHGGHEQRY